jgi:hypothetical protein
MYAKIFNFKFNGVAEAKVAASFISDAFGKLIVANNMRSLNISIGKCGSLSIQTKFETGDDLKLFESRPMRCLWISSKPLFIKRTHTLEFIFSIMKQRLLRRRS